MVAPRHLTFTHGDVLLLVGTMKGLFVLKSNAGRSKWDAGGPYFPGRAVYAAAYDGRAGRRRIWAGQDSAHYGPGISSSDDFGKSWHTEPDGGLRFPDDAGATLERIWQIHPGTAGEPEVLHCGVSPAALFRSVNNGKTWELVRGLWNHPHREKWEPGGGGLCLHTIVQNEENRMTVAVSAAGVYRTDDGGASWKSRNHGIRAEFLPDQHPEFGQCVHKVVNHPSRPNVMFLQNHWGLYRSNDAGDSWRDIAKGVPSDFGFAMAMHPHDPDTVYIVPIESDGYRCTPEGKLRVYRTKNGGGSWEPLVKGLPQKNALETILRDGLTTDPLKPTGVYFGTRSGDVWGSRNDGASWQLVFGGLPPVVCVKAAIVGDPMKARPVRAKTVRAPAKKAATKKRSRAAAGARRAKASTSSSRRPTAKKPASRATKRRAKKR